MNEIVHFGMKGMKWGVRKERHRQRYHAIAAGKATLMDKVKFGLDTNIIELAVNKGNAKKAAAGRAAVLDAQKKRVESGNANIWDKLDRILNTPVWDLARNR